jgi:SAM-dependent methyltransferase
MKPHSNDSQSMDSHSIFSNKAGDYAAARPGYPTALFVALAESYPPSNAVVADVGAGTGLLTQGLLNAAYQVIAVEPNAEMRHEADVRLGSHSGYRSVDGSAEATSLPAHLIDLITVAQAFHWFDVEHARAEFLRILKPSGKVALIANERLPEDQFNRALEGVFKGIKNLTRTTSNLGNAPQFFGASRFDKYSWPHKQRLDKNGLLSLVFSRSHMPDRGSAEGLQVVERVRELFDRFENGGMIVVRYQTIAMIGRPQ